MDPEILVRKIINKILIEDYDYLRPSGCIKKLSRGKRKGKLCGKKVITEKIHYCKKHSGVVLKKEIPDIIQCSLDIEIMDVYETDDGKLVDDKGKEVNFTL